MDRSMDIILGLIVAILVALIGLCIYAIVMQSKDCHSRGGEMVGNGTYSTVFIQSGNVMIPMESENLECSK